MDSNSWLLKYAREGNYDELSLLLKFQQFETDLLNGALIQAVKKSWSTSDHLLCIEALLSSGAEVNFGSDSSETCLMTAAQTGQIELVELFLRSGATVDQQDAEFKTPLHYSVLSRADNVDVVELLIKANAFIDASDVSGKTALHYAAEKGHTDAVASLLKHTASIDTKDAESRTPLDIANSLEFEHIAQQIIAKKPKIKIPDPIAKPSPKKKAINAQANKLIACQKCKELFTRGQLEAIEIENQNCYVCFGCNTPPEKARKERKDTNYGYIEFRFDEMINVLTNQINQQREMNEKMLSEIENYETQLRELSEPKITYVEILKIKANPKIREKAAVIEELDRGVAQFTDELYAWQAVTHDAYASAVKELQILVNKEWPHVNLAIYGSFGTKLYLPSSDIDLLIWDTPSQMSPYEFLDKLWPTLQAATGEFIVKVWPILTAAVPIVKLEIHHMDLDISIDLTVNDIRHRGLQC